MLTCFFRFVPFLLFLLQDCKFGFVSHLFSVEASRELQRKLHVHVLYYIIVNYWVELNGCDAFFVFFFFVIPFLSADGSPRGQMCRITPAMAQHSRYMYSVHFQ